jgi:hypothetical protein
MDEPGNHNSPGSADSLERLLTVLGPRLDDVRTILGDVTSRWHGDALRVGEETKRRLHDRARAGARHARESDEFELRVAQLEHRLRLLETFDRRSPATGFARNADGPRSRSQRPFPASDTDLDVRELRQVTDFRSLGVSRP